MSTIPDLRFETGEVCPRSGCYLFDGYVGRSSDALPDFGEMEVFLDQGTPFPPAGNGRERCYWKFQYGHGVEILSGDAGEVE